LKGRNFASEKRITARKKNVINARILKFLSDNSSFQTSFNSTILPN
jgi:hypothetical protein